MLRRLLSFILALQFMLPTQGRADSSHYLLEPASQFPIQEVRSRTYDQYKLFAGKNLLDSNLITPELATGIDSSAMVSVRDMYRHLVFAITLSRLGFTFAADRAYEKYVESTLAFNIDLAADIEDEIKRVEALEIISHRLADEINIWIETMTESEKYQVYAGFKGAQGYFTDSSIKNLLSNLGSGKIKVWQQDKTDGLVAMLGVISGSVLFVFGMAAASADGSFPANALRLMPWGMGVASLFQAPSSLRYVELFKLSKIKKKAREQYKNVGLSCARFLSRGSGGQQL